MDIEGEGRRHASPFASPFHESGDPRCRNHNDASTSTAATRSTPADPLIELPSLPGFTPDPGDWRAELDLEGGIVLRLK